MIIDPAEGVPDAERLALADTLRCRKREECSQGEK